LRPDATFADVYVNDSFEAADAITKGEAFARQGRWTEAAEILQRASDAAGGKLVRLSPGFYVDVREHINRIIAVWPRAGLAAYRALFERQIQERAGRVETLTRTVPGPGGLETALRLFDRYFCTASAAQLADAIGQLAIESGDLALAEHVYGRVLKHHPDKAAYASSYQAMLTLLLVMRGEPPVFPDESAQDTKIRWKGRDRTLRDVIADVREGFAALRTPTSPSVWPIFGGNTERNRRATTQVDELGLLWRFEAFATGGAGGDAEEIEITGSAERDRARRLSIHPAVSGGLMLAQRVREIVALHVNTGALAWRFRTDGTDSGSYSYLDEQPPGWDAVTIHGGRVYASLPGETLPYYSYESARIPPELLCLDARTGRVIWRVNQEAIEEAFAEVAFDSSPVIRHGRMYIVGRRRRSFGFEDCYLYRFDATDGTLEQRTHLGSASTGTFASRQITKAIVAIHTDTAFVCTNLGSVAAVATHSGAVRWLRLYQRDRVQAGGEGRFSRDDTPWHINPVIWSNGRVIVLPTDATRILVLDAEDGRLLRSIPLDRVGDMETLLGVSGDLLCGVGSRVSCYDLAADSLRWSSPLPDGESLHGRGIWVDDQLYIPTEENLLTFRVADGRRSNVAWDSEARGGNLLATPEMFFVADAGRISAYVRKMQIWRTLRERMAAAPSDPLPALELAEIALGNGEYAEAVTVLREAVRRADRLGEPLETAVARRLFDDVLMFADRLEAHSKLDSDLVKVLFSYASKYPPDGPAHLRYRFRFAELFEEREQPARAVRIYQQILTDRSLRELPVDPLWTLRRQDASTRAAFRVATVRERFRAKEPNLAGAQSGGGRAQDRIARLIAEHGCTIYAPYEAEARAWLTSARTAGDLSLMRRVVETFPNSAAAPLALIAQGELLSGLGRPLQAAKRFARAYHRYPQEVDRPAMLRRIADAYEAGGRAEHAYLWLTKAAREHPSVRIEHEGRSLTFREYRRRLSHVRERVEPSRPSLSPPLRNHSEQELPERAALLAPRFGDDPASDWSRYFVHSPEGIRAYEARSGTALEQWHAGPAAVRADAELLIATADVAVFATSYEVFALDVSTGARRWSHGEYPKQLDLQDGDWEDGGAAPTASAFRAHALHRGRLVSVRDSGEMTCVAIDTGEKLWSRTHQPVPVGRLRLAETWLAYHVIQDERVVVCLVDAATGMWFDAIITEERGAVEDLFVTVDEQIVVAMSRTILSLDPEAHKLRWRVSLAGHLRRASLLADIDALYFSTDGRSVTKISLDDGRVLWQSEQLTRRGDDDLTVRRQDANIILSTVSSVSAVDAVTGLTLWQGTTPERPRFAARLLTGSYVIAVDVPGELPESECAAYFYDHRNASGMIARDGGAAPLGRLTDVRTILALDNALLIQTGSTIHRWSPE
jgi:outer membrane protein assembly factor BamB